MWTAKLTSVSKTGRMIVVVVRFERGDEIIDVPINGDNLTLDRVKVHVRDVINSLEARDTAFDTLKALEGRAVELPAPDDAKIAAQTFFDTRAKLAAVEKAIAEGLSKDTATRDALSVQLKELFLPDYTTDFRWS